MSMKKNLGYSLLAGAFALTLAIPAWAADEAKSADTTQEKVASKSLSSDEVKKLQEALKEKGDDPGSVDGHMGRKTHAAVRAFQKSNGLKVTGSVDKETADKLGIEIASTSATSPMKDEKK
jgi:peptidoglycan hydrolase-like protein with peptidoglycan-binding domain